ncbi:MAG: Hsp33 family molecular chaperone HslO [SAR324 cluster bacterium]|uniref:33 kDa chaperonin n=1 Tax=SAR324 cluster bacterium TaxID=2024889 RepID=A0A2A4T8R2_9DELT|nr:MAG: Hsp33 family molecular chaperone HslO [SAR324 cluster bacterium]
MTEQDTLQRFIFENTDSRGELVHLEKSYQSALERREYPPAIRQLLGEVMVAATLLSATIKFKGKLSLQLKSEGLLKILLVQITHDQKMRAMADWSGEVTDQTFPALIGRAYFSITIEPEKGERYQGIVPLDKDTFSLCLEEYFQQSEQLPTKIRLEVSETKAAGLLLQTLPQQEDLEGEKGWEHVTTLAATIKREELLDLSNEELLYRLYHAEQVRLFETQPVIFRCLCSQERCEQAILTLGAAEIKDIMEEDQQASMKCEFCNTDYILDLVDLARLHKQASENFADA